MEVIDRWEKEVEVVNRGEQDERWVWKGIKEKDVGYEFKYIYLNE